MEIFWQTYILSSYIMLITFDILDHQLQSLAIYVRFFSDIKYQVLKSWRHCTSCYFVLVYYLHLITFNMLYQFQPLEIHLRLIFYFILSYFFIFFYFFFRYLPFVLLMCREERVKLSRLSHCIIMKRNKTHNHNVTFFLIAKMSRRMRKFKWNIKSSKISGRK